MNILKEFFSMINPNHLIILPNKKIILVIYLLMFVILFLENAILPAFFLPGDSLLIVVGILIKKEVLNFFVTVGILTIAVSLGSWMSYLQGKFLKDKKYLQFWLSYLSQKSRKKAYHMFCKYGLCALFISRFIMLLRTVLPTLVGISGLNWLKFQLFNWISSFVWVLMLIIVGFFVGYSESFIFC